MTTPPLIFDGSTIVRGPKGWFHLTRARLKVHWRWPKRRKHPTVVLHLDARELPNTGLQDEAVAMLFNNPEELRTFIAGLAKALTQMTTQKET